MCARQRTHFLLLRQKKVSKEKATPSLRPLRFRYGADLRRGTCGVPPQNSLRAARSVRTAAASQSTRHGREGAHAHPASTPPQAQPAGVGSRTRAIAALGLARARFALRRLQCAVRAPDRAERSDGPAVSPNPSVRAEKRRAAGACGCRRTHALRALTYRSMFERSAQRAVSSAAAPADRASQVARSEAEGHAQWGRLFFAYFLLAKQKKVSRLPGRVPAPASHQTQRLEQAPSALTPTLSRREREQDREREPSHTPHRSPAKPHIVQRPTVTRANPDKPPK